MPAVMLTVDDLTPFAAISEGKAEAMIASAMARAARVAPCIRDTELSDDNAEAAKSVIRDAVLRWNDSGTGAVASESVGPFSQTLDTRQPRKVLFWPSEIAELQAICSDHNQEATAGAFAVDTVATAGRHMPWCDLMFGGAACSCGISLTAGEYPIYEAP